MSLNRSSKKSKVPCRKNVAKKKKVIPRFSEPGEEICLEHFSSVHGDDLSPAPHPLDSMDIDEMLEYLVSLRMRYPGYILYFKREQSPRIFGSMNWWELKGIRNE